MPLNLISLFSKAVFMLSAASVLLFMLLKVDRLEMSLIYAILKSSLTPDLSISYFVFWLLLTLYLYLHFRSVSHRLPPGPLGLPVVGYLPFLGYEAHLKFRQLGIKYGNIFSFYLGRQLTVVLNDYDAIKEALGKRREEFAGRSTSLVMDFTDNHHMNFFNSDGEQWKKQRRFAMSTLRDLGMGKTGHEPILLDESYECLKELTQGDVHEAKDIATPIGRCFANNIFMFICGRRYDYQDPFLLQLKWMSDMVIRHLDLLSITTVFPWIIRIPYVGYLLDHRSVLRKVFMDAEAAGVLLTEEFKKSASEPHRDNYIHLTLAEKQRRQSRKPDDNLFTDMTLSQNLVVLFLAGTETLSITTQWGIIYLVNYPEVQLKLQREIDAKIGRDRSPSYGNRSQTPYVEAAILEILRMSSLLPLSITYRNKVDVQMGGYVIPKNSVIVANLWNVHYDSKLWKNPDTFQPERFLSESGELLKTPDYLMPFSKGKHQCAGETLARMELYMHLTMLLQKFTFKTPPGCSPPSMEPYRGPNFTRRPKYFKVCCVPR